MSLLHVDGFSQPIGLSRAERMGGKDSECSTRCQGGAGTQHPSHALRRTYPNRGFDRTGGVGNAKRESQRLPDPDEVVKHKLATRNEVPQVRSVCARRSQCMPLPTRSREAYVAA